jgi:hypothetical protein
LDDEIATSLRNMNCRVTCFGIESGSQKVLELIKKKQYDINNNSSSVYLNINSCKDFCIYYCDNKFELITLLIDEKGNIDIYEIEEYS